MRKGWELKQLGDVCDFENGDRGTNYPSKSARVGMGVPFINAGHLTENGLDFSTMDYISKERFDLLGSGKLKKNDILFCLRGSLGKTASVGNLTEGAIASSLVIVRPRNLILNKFLLYYLKSKICSDMITFFGNGAAQPNLSAGNLKLFKIPIPPLSEQKRIVAILDEAFAAIDQTKANVEKNLLNARELFESYLQGVFGNPGKDWEEKRLNEVSQNLDSKRIPITKSKRKKGTYPYYGASGIVDYVADFIFESDLLLVSEDGANLLARTYPIAFSISGRTWVNNHAHVLQFKHIESQRFVEYYLNSIDLDDYVSGMAQPKLNQAMLNAIPIPYPPLKVQKSIVEKLDILTAEIKNLETLYRQKLTDLEELKKSILQKAFAGELTHSTENIPA